MNGRERGFLLLSSHLGNPDRKPLTIPQLRQLGQRIRLMAPSAENRAVASSDLTALGYGIEMARHIVNLLEEEDCLDYYLQQGAKNGCVPITRVSEGYPMRLRMGLGMESPGVLWARGDIALLQKPAVALVGSRDLEPENRTFAAEVGRQAARHGFVLVSGNARGADRTAQSSCLAAGGQVISVVADELDKQPLRQNLLYLSEDGFHETFTAQRALSRNRIIHAMGMKTFVAQSRYSVGGTWDGTVKNLRAGWSTVYCFDDGSTAVTSLAEMGALRIGMEKLADFDMLPEAIQSFL